MVKRFVLFLLLYLVGAAVVLADEWRQERCGL